MKPSIPEILYTETSNLYNQFVNVSVKIGDTKEHCNHLFELIPEGIKSTAVWKDKLTGIWRYEYGKSYKNMINKLKLIGADQFPPIENLYHAIKVADKNLNSTELVLFRTRLSNKSKHIETSFEMRPLINIFPGYMANYEVTGYGQNNKSIDWFVIMGNLGFLFDVKHRRKSFINQIGNMDFAKSTNENTKFALPPDPSDLFRSTIEKFKSIENNIIQGVWITTSIQEDKMLLDDYFANELDSNKIQFAIVSDWKDDAYILTRTDIQKENLKRVFNILESDRFVTNYSSDSEKTENLKLSN